MIPEILFELCSGQKCGLQTDGLTDKCKTIYPHFFEGGHNNQVLQFGIKMLQDKRDIYRTQSMCGICIPQSQHKNHKPQSKYSIFRHDQYGIGSL